MSLSVIAILSIPSAYNVQIFPKAQAIGAWNGQNLYSVPISWCLIAGSPSDFNPAGIYDPAYSDSILTSRIPPVNDHIYRSAAGTWFKSASTINSLHHERIGDQDTSLGNGGDVENSTLDNERELRLTLHYCEEAWIVNNFRADPFHCCYINGIIATQDMLLFMN